MRPFLAIDLPAEVKQSLAAIARPPLNALKWAKPEQLHVTLKFLGEVPDDDLPRLIDQLEAVPKPPAMQLRVEGEALFPERGLVRIVGADVADESRCLATLAAELEQVGESFGVEPEARPFHAHITLARAKPPVRRDRVLVQIPPMEFLAAAFVLMGSRLSPAGSAYEVVKAFPLSS